MRGVVPEFRVGKDNLPAVQRICEHCAVEFLAVKSGVAQGRGRFCGRRCAALAKRPSQHSAHGTNHPNFKHGRFVDGAMPPQIKRALKAVEKAVRLGHLVNPGICERCHGRKRVDAHHEDYSKPLDIVWFCRQCHMDRHAEMATVVPM